ncbi:FeoB-associated Cys-rich membrane protein [Anaeromicrobium sediminis]|uniref:FeoB-associated Cys-rich membrane protein n=1 Tax=Anaeromicrobium sediminis TaxID=1478221 RepID=A0A267MMB5_9FIRM|nr:hypothetical protein CCE28_08290 [Anaeromicrobium sediminis]
MLPNIIVGLIFAGIVFWAFKRARNDVKNSRCGGCSSCSSKSKCNTKK